MRYHLTRDGYETTVSIDNILSEMLALKLGRQPDGKDAHQAVRLWLQDRLDRSANPGRIHVSQWLQAQIVEEIAAPELRRAWDRWFDRAVAGGRYRGRRPRARQRA